MSLTERLNDRRQDNPTVVPIVERRIEQRPIPVWLRRMQDGKLPPKDLTGRVAA